MYKKLKQWPDSDTSRKWTLQTTEGKQEKEEKQKLDLEEENLRDGALKILKSKLIIDNYWKTW